MRELVEARGWLTALPGGPCPPEHAERANAPVALTLSAFSRGAHARLRAPRQRRSARPGVGTARGFLRAWSARQSLASSDSVGAYSAAQAKPTKRPWWESDR